MANEFKLNVSQTLDHGTAGIKVGVPFEVIQFTPAVQGYFHDTPAIPTTAGGTVLAVTNITSFGYAYFKNLGPTNYVEIGPESGGAIIPLIRLKAGRTAWLPLKPGVAMRALANTAAVALEVMVFESD